MPTQPREMLKLLCSLSLDGETMFSNMATSSRSLLNKESAYMDSIGGVLAKVKALRES